MSNGIDKNPLLDISKVYLTQVAEKKDDSYLEPDMKKRQKNNEKARKELAKGPQMKNPHFEEKRQEWDSGIVNSLAGAYKAMQEVEHVDEMIDPKGAVRMDAAKGKKKSFQETQDEIDKRLMLGKHSPAVKYAKTQKEGLDPVGKEDGDVNNDGKKNTKTDKYLMNRRKAIGSAIKNKMSSMKKEETEAAEYIETVAKVKEVERQNDIKRWVQKESRSSNWRNDLSEVMTDDIDSKPIKEKNVKNKIKINPKLGEAIEEIGGTVVEMVEVDEAVYGGTPAKKEDDRMTVTNADKKANTPAYRAYKAGNKKYKSADHMNEGDGDPCWDSHKQVGMKKKGGKMVPNCVPKNEEVEVEEYVDFLITEGYDCSDLTWDDMYEEYQSLDEGLRSAVKRLLGKKKEEPAKPMSRGDQLRKKYNVGPEKSDTSAKAQILKKTRAKAERDQKEFGGSRYSKGVADRSKAAHERQLKGGYSKYGADDARGSGNKARKRAAALTKEELEQIEELHKGRHGQSEKEYQDSRSDAGKMISGDSKGSGANYSYRAKNTGPNPAGGSKKPQGQARMGSKDRAYLKMRKANLRKEEASMTPQELQLQKKKAMVDRMIAQKRQQSLNKAKKTEPPAKAMGEATEDSLRDRRMERGGLGGNQRYNKPVSNTPNTFGKKKPKYDGMSALEKVKASIRAKHGQGAIKEDAKMAKQSDEKLAALHKQVSGSDQSLPSNQFMMKRVTKEMNRRKKAT
jgi:hypothetical protein